MTEQAASEVFTCEELWLLQSAVRHEVSQGEQWKFPPASLELNHQIAEALLLCDEYHLTEAAIVLDLADCLVIDYCVPQTAKSPSGAPIGKNVLLKSFRARRAIDGGLNGPEAVEPAQLTPGEVREHLRQMQGD
ncbi:MAG: hypothetical protein C0506_14805 [Anaerolinea sp.]|nr:hypothetical protein [Anaerolinea sp.]